MIDPFIFSSSVMLSVKWARSHLFASGLSDSTRLDRASGSRAAALLMPSRRQASVFQLSLQQQLSGEHDHFVGRAPGPC